ncbi:PKD domain-containing protein [Haliscomenobacter hydrossis]|uniref:PKD domain containing protein n=1 Tax=Haliscomenobacter hydrossis (strain ATCC 27775 / DSM 1100 / LMG 10767 / O) TaxID=760192 RepID=F4L8A4_HALH1|nr:PKD domain-containing protein [Haliscomenobacter hydrossis]AEE54612.1 PKD domain containing protein [Haliscomenobacter hydrossis DSM 1100]
MKKYLFFSNFWALLFLGFVVLFASCDQQGLIGEAIYPTQNFYMSQAAVATVGPGANGIYTITPRIEGVATRFIIDAATKKFNVPLGVIRSGVSLDGDVDVSVLTNTDTINKLIALNKFAVADPAVTTELLPASAFTLPGSLTVKDGESNANFILPIDLNFLINSLNDNPKKRYAMGVSIKPNTNADNPQIVPLRTTVILIDPAQVLLAAANFSSFVYTETKTGNFSNGTANGVSYSWNFGDGSPAETTASPSHKYAAAGTYTVTLTATGVAGPPSVKTASIVIP